MEPIEPTTSGTSLAGLEQQLAKLHIARRTARKSMLQATKFDGGLAPAPARIAPNAQLALQSKVVVYRIAVKHNPKRIELFLELNKLKKENSPDLERINDIEEQLKEITHFTSVNKRTVLTHDHAGGRCENGTQPQIEFDSASRTPNLQRHVVDVAGPSEPKTPDSDAASSGSPNKRADRKERYAERRLRFAARKAEKKREVDEAMKRSIEAHVQTINKLVAEVNALKAEHCGLEAVVQKKLKNRNKKQKKMAKKQAKKKNAKACCSADCAE